MSDIRREVNSLVRNIEGGCEDVGYVEEWMESYSGDVLSVKQRSALETLRQTLSACQMPVLEIREMIDDLCREIEEKLKEKDLILS